jgi:uncharacterized protein (TIGR03437 family)
MLRIALLAGVFSCAVVWPQSTNYIISAGYTFPGDTPVAPGQVITLFVRGLNVSDAFAHTLPLPTMLGGITVAVKNPPTPAYPTALPIFSVRSYPNACGGGLDEFCNITAVTVQIPYEATCIPNQFPNSCTIGARPSVKISVQADGVEGQELWLSIGGALPHLLNSCDAIWGRPSGECSPLVTHADGRLVSWNAPAHLGEEVALFAVGLGDTQRGEKTGQAAISPDQVAGDVYLGLAFRINSPPASKFVVSAQSIKAEWAGLVKGFVGLYQINVRLPAALPDGTQECPGENLNVRLLWLGSLPLESMSNGESVDVCVSR